MVLVGLSNTFILCLCITSIKCNMTSYCRANDIFCRVMDTFEVIIRSAVALLILCNSFLPCLKKKPAQAILWLPDF